MGVVVRDMLPGDAVLLAAQLRDDPWCAGWPGPDLSLDAVLLTATLDDTPVGFVMGEMVDETSAALVVWVSPLWRRRGVGSALVSALSLHLAVDGVRELEAVIDASNSAMGALACSAGFTCVDGDGVRGWWRRRL